MIQERRQRVKRIAQYISNKVGGQQHLAIFMCILSNIFFPLAFIYPSENNIHTAYTTLARGFSVVITHLFVCQYYGLSIDVQNKSDFKYLMLRNIPMMIHQVAYTFMYFVVSYPIVNTITSSGPIFVFIIDYYLHKQPINSEQIKGVILGIIGVILTINGDLIMNKLTGTTPPSKFQNYLFDSLWVKVVISFIYLLLNIAWAYAIVIQKKIKSLQGAQISLNLGIVFTASAGIWINSGTVKDISYSQFFMTILMTGVVVSLCQINYISAVSLTKQTGVLTMTNFIGIFISYIVSLFRFGQSLNIICVIGLIAIIYGVYQVVIKKN